MGRSGIRLGDSSAQLRPGSDEKRPLPHRTLPSSGETSSWPPSVAETPLPNPGTHLQLGPLSQVGLNAVTVAGARAGVDDAVHNPAGVHHVHHEHAHHQAGEGAAAAPHGAVASGRSVAPTRPGPSRRRGPREPPSQRPLDALAVAAHARAAARRRRRRGTNAPGAADHRSPCILLPPPSTCHRGIRRRAGSFRVLCHPTEVGAPHGHLGSVV